MSEKGPGLAADALCCSSANGTCGTLLIKQWLMQAMTFPGIVVASPGILDGASVCHGFCTGGAAFSDVPPATAASELAARSSASLRSLAHRESIRAMASSKADGCCVAVAIGLSAFCMAWRQCSKLCCSQPW